MRRRFTSLVIPANLLVLVALAFVYPEAMVSPGPLVPAHAELGSRCFSCHAPLRAAPAERCVACHAVADIGLRTTTGAPVTARRPGATGTAFHQELLEENCAACHSDHQRPTRRRFSHSLLRTDTRTRCERCHEAPSDDLHGTLRESCQSCHSIERWTPATFDHDRLAPAKLAQCAGCHKAPLDDMHRDAGDSCRECHSTQRWKPSTFDHDRYFLLDRDHQASCATCHPRKDLKQYTCYGCHEHTVANIREEHEEEGIRDYQDCIRCHRSADEEPGEGSDRGDRGGGREHDDDD